MIYMLTDVKGWSGCLVFPGSRFVYVTYQDNKKLTGISYQVKKMNMISEQNSDRDENK